MTNMKPRDGFEMMASIRAVEKTAREMGLSSSDERTLHWVLVTTTGDPRYYSRDGLSPYPRKQREATPYATREKAEAAKKKDTAAAHLRPKRIVMRRPRLPMRVGVDLRLAVNNMRPQQLTIYTTVLAPDVDAALHFIEARLQKLLGGKV